MLQDPPGGNDGYLRVGEVAERLGVSPSTVRLWERRFELTVPRRSPGGHRRYSLTDVDQLRAVRDLVQRGHPLGRHDPGTLEVVLAVTRAVLLSRTPAEVRDIVVTFVRMSGGAVVAADQADGEALPLDLSFGEGDPLLATPHASNATWLRLARTLPAVHEDARRVVALLRADTRPGRSRLGDGRRHDGVGTRQRRSRSASS